MVHENFFKVRIGLAKLFQYKAIYLLEDLISPVVTPFMLYFGLRPKAQEIVDFLRQFTVEVMGVGDVCSYAQMDLYKHGQPQLKESVTSRSQSLHHPIQDSIATNNDCQFQVTVVIKFKYNECNI